MIDYPANADISRASASPGSKPETGGEEMLEKILELVLMILRIAQAVIELVELLIS